MFRRILKLIAGLLTAFVFIAITTMAVKDGRNLGYAMAVGATAALVPGFLLGLLYVNRAI